MKRYLLLFQKKYNKSNVQIILRWHVQAGNIVIPKSTNPNHILDNINIFDFELTSEEMTSIYEIDKKERYFVLSEKEQEERFLSWILDFNNQK